LTHDVRQARECHSKQQPHELDSIFSTLLFNQVLGTLHQLSVRATSGRDSLVPLDGGDHLKRCLQVLDTSLLASGRDIETRCVLEVRLSKS